MRCMKALRKFRSCSLPRRTSSAVTRFTTTATSPNSDQHIRLDLGRGKQAAVGIIKNAQGDYRQRGGIDQRHQDAGAMIAICFP